MSFGRRINRCSSGSRQKKEEDERSIDRLPLDISKDIISRLPIRSIIQSRCVCRSWELLSRDPHVFSRRCPGSKFLFFHVHKGNELHFIEFNNSDENFGIVSKIGKPSFANDMPEFRVTASCNGLLCLQEFNHYDDWICIYSPFTRDYKVIPKPDSKYSPYANGFGCHPVTREYKLVRIGYYYGDGDDDDDDDDHIMPPPESEVQVYSLSRNEWKSVGRLPDEQLDEVESSEGGVLLGGRLHWLSSLNRWDLWPRPPCPGLIYFDLSDDSLGIVPMPAETILTNSWSPQLVVLGGCLSIAVFKFDDPTEWMQIWVMKEYGVEQSWVKQYSLVGNEFRKIDPMWQPDWVSVCILCLLDGGEILLEHKGKMLISYNCDTKIYKKVTFGGTLPQTKSWFNTTLDASC